MGTGVEENTSVVDIVYAFGVRDTDTWSKYNCHIKCTTAPNNNFLKTKKFYLTECLENSAFTLQLEMGCELESERYELKTDLTLICSST